MPGYGPAPANFAEQYAQDMADAAITYADAITVAATITGAASMTQLGGMCLAIECHLEGGWLWITDEDDNLPWNRPEHHTGWSVGIHAGDHLTQDHEEPVVFLTTTDTTLAGLRSVLTGALAQFTRTGPSPATRNLTTTTSPTG
jgi:hypothetical protein